MTIQAALAKPFEERIIINNTFGSGKYKRCHPNFRIFAIYALPMRRHHQLEDKIDTVFVLGTIEVVCDLIYCT